MTNLAILDDDRDIRNSLAKYLNQNGFTVFTVGTGQELDALLIKKDIDLLILDIMLPEEDGFSICKRLQVSSSIPIILLTALVEDTDRIVGLELGADDYVTKPFNPRELLARIKTVIKRSQMMPAKAKFLNNKVRFDKWQFTFSQKEIIDNTGTVVKLSSSEHAVLLALIEHTGNTLTRERLLELTKGREAQMFDRSIDNQISRLRKKIEVDPKEPKIIITDWGGGYAFVADMEWLK